MAIKVAIHQPQYLPWLGYFDKIDSADFFVFLDNVQFKKNEWQNRNRIKSMQGWQWITVPVYYNFGQKINEIRIDNKVDWRRKHLQALISNYSKAPYFKEHREFLEETYSREWGFLTDINIWMIKNLALKIGIEKRFIIASELALSEDPTERLLDICRHLNADTYLSGKDGAKYMDIKRFQESGVKIVFQDYQHPMYNQLYGTFEACMSAIDLMFNYGPESIAILRKGRRWVPMNY